MMILPPMTAEPEVLSTKASLPSFHTICQDLKVHDPLKKERMFRSPVLSAPMASPPIRHHFRATSEPTRLPSQQPAFTPQQLEDRLSMDILLKAIALDQKMSSKYKKERVKSYVREQQMLHRIRRHAWPPVSSKPSMSLRRRSRSAPGAPLAHYHHGLAWKTNARWYLPAKSDSSFKSCDDVAKAVVEQHLRSAVFYQN
ncbi:hypothetical protein DM01DRAFT_1346938 [Hesseltinella vesiculosa]|uniref:Uncharacterized protein n=1 Tax=Hesseltinella vesiculosa TaxID=101127 RepID=A0A1X2GE01_9FUNG|nr:hypothetical protein DM01DRAFT_1346938 [Hesseltinella vesiculosa]